MSYYEILGIDKNTSQDEIKKKYRKLSLQHHPDRPNGDAEKFKKINEAYETLGDSQKRKMYDMQQNNPFMNMGGMPGGIPCGMPGGIPGGMPGGMHDINDIMSSIFKGMHEMNSNESIPGFPFMGGMDMFGGMPNVHVYRNGRRVNINMSKPSPITKTIEISLEDAFNGVNYPIEIERWIVQNKMKTTEKEKIYVNIPKGIDNNEIIMVEGKGNVVNTNRRGDVKIFIKIKNTTKMERQGLNLIYRKSITLKEALTGFSFQLEYFNNKTYTINNTDGKIIKPGFETVINNLGMSRKEKKGNLIILFNVQFPNSLTNEQIEELKKIL